MEVILLLSMSLISNPEVEVYEVYIADDMQHCHSYGESIELAYENGDIDVYYECHREI